MSIVVEITILHASSKYLLKEFIHFKVVQMDFKLVQVHLQNVFNVLIAQIMLWLTYEIIQPNNS